MRMNNNYLLFALLIAAGGVMTLQKLDCPAGCAECRTNGGKTWCLSCVEKVHTLPASGKYTDLTCEDGADVIPDCAKQAIVWAFVGNTNTKTALQSCRTCKTGFGLVSVPVDSTVTLIAGGTTINSECKAPVLAGVATSTFVKSADPTPVYTETPTSCLQGKKKDSTPTATACIDIDPAADKQVLVENCYGYLADVCSVCADGYGYAMTPTSSIVRATTREYWEACVQLPDSIVGCSGGLSISGGCEACNVKMGYYAKQVIADAAPGGQQSQICTNGEKTTQVMEL